MLIWALLFLIVSIIIAGLLGFGDVASTATGFAKILILPLFVLFLVTAIASLFG